MDYQTAICSGLAALLTLASVPSISGQAVEPGPITTVTVDARHPWVDTGLTVRKGERLTFQAEGIIRWGTDPDRVAGPEGHGARGDKVGRGGLIGRVGVVGKPFPIGKVRTPIVMPKDGRLFLGINDFIFKDNAGAFTVTIGRAAP